MPRGSIVIALTLIVSVLVSYSVHAADDLTRARSLEPVNLCEGENLRDKHPACKTEQPNELIGRAGAAIAKVLTTARPATAVMLKRDQAWFRDLIAHDTGEEGFAELMRERVSTLEGISLARPALIGRWESAFGTIDV